MTQYDDQPVEQILFGLTRPGGVGLQKWSVGLTSRDADDWNDRLRRYNRLSPTMIDSRPWVPERAYSYFEFGDRTAALLTRFNTVESGRNSSHALVGAAPTLRPYAMFLSRWEGWRSTDPGYALSSVNPSDWLHLCTRWMDHALLSANENRGVLTELVREVLLRHGSHVTLVLQTDPLPLLTLLRGVLDPVLSTPDGDYGWTYSTYEDSDTTPESRPDEDGAPRFWCVRSLPTSGQTGRHRVQVDQGVADDLHLALAADLVETYLKDPSQYPRTIAAFLSGVDGRPSRVGRLLEDQRQTQYAQSRPAAQAHPPRRTSQDHPEPSRPQPEYGDVAYTEQSDDFPYAPTTPTTPSTPVAATRVEPRDTATTKYARSRRVNRHPPDAAELFAKINDVNLSHEQRRRAVTELKNLWDGDDPYQSNIRVSIVRVERRLRTHEIVLGATVLGLILSALLAWSTATREITVPPPATITVTVTPQLPTAQNPETPSPTPPREPRSR